MRETWVRSLGQEDLMEKEMATHSSICAEKIPWMEQATVHGVTKSRTQLSDFTFTLYRVKSERKTSIVYEHMYMSLEK